MSSWQNIDLKKEIIELQKNDPGKERGGDIKYLVRYVKENEGEDRLRKIIDELEKNGYRLPDVSLISDMEWVPSSLPTIFMLAIAKVLDWSDEDVIKMGEGSISMNKTTVFFIRFFLSPKKSLTESAKKWQSHYTFGHMETELYDKEKYCILRLRDFKKHAITCLYFKGGFKNALRLITGRKKLTCKETKCIFRGDDCHEYKISWQ